MSSDYEKANNDAGQRKRSEVVELPERLLVPSTLEHDGSGTDKYLVSRQIPNMQEPAILLNDDLEERKIIYPEATDKEVVNRFRKLRTRLLEISRGDNFTLVVSASAAGGGASFVSVNLAAAFAFDASKTAVLVDCNLAKPSLDDLLTVKPEVGLTDFLEDPNLDIGSVIYPTGIKRLRLVPVGSHREYFTEHLTSFRMKQFLHAIKRRYPDRFVILKAPSFGESPDAKILSEVCDYSLLVVQHARAMESEVARCVNEIAKEKFVGVVINN